MARNSDPKHWADLCESKCLTLMHLYLMVFKQYLKEKNQKAFVKTVLSEDIIRDEMIENYANAASTLLRKVSAEKGQVSKDEYRQIRDRLRNSEMTAFDKQYQKLKNLKWISSNELWGAMKMPHEQVDNRSYMDEWMKHSPWLFVERVLDDPNDDLIYRLLTVAIFISVNQQTGLDANKKDELDILCEEYLKEQIPDFSLRTLFNTLFENHLMLAVKQGDHYVPVDRDILTDLDRIKILLPDNTFRHDFVPKSREDAQRLLDNQIDQETAQRVLGFFECYGDSIWSLLVSHIRESFVHCQLANHMKLSSYDIEIIEAELNSEKEQNFAEKTQVYRNRLKDNTKWITDVCDVFWGGIKANVSLPPKVIENDSDADELYGCIATYILIAVCCLKMDGSAAPKKRRSFREKLEKQIGNVFFGTNQGSAELLREKDQIIANEKSKSAKKDSEIEEYQSGIRKVMDDWLQELHQCSDIDRRADILKNLRRLIRFAKYSQNEMIDMMKALDKEEAKSRQLKNNPPGWDNGGK